MSTAEHLAGPAAQGAAAMIGVNLSGTTHIVTAPYRLGSCIRVSARRVDCRWVVTVREGEHGAVMAQVRGVTRFTRTHRRVNTAVLTYDDTSRRSSGLVG
jgi:hypothetical protein